MTKDQTIEFLMLRLEKAEARAEMAEAELRDLWATIKAKKRAHADAQRRSVARQADVTFASLLTTKEESGSDGSPCTPSLAPKEETPPKTPPTEGQKGSTENEAIEAVFSEYQRLIQPQAKLLPIGRDKIRARLRTWGEDGLRSAIDHFSEDTWEMGHNAHRGAGWFFHTDQRIEQYILLKPRLVEVPRNSQHPHHITKQQLEELGVGA